MSIQTDDHQVWVECNKCHDCGVEMKGPKRDSRLEAVRAALFEGWSILEDGDYAKCPDCRNYGNG